jgi:excisionase family DNA binding protein
MNHINNAISESRGRVTQVPTEFFSVEQVADLLGLQARTVRQYLRDNRLPGTKIGKQYRIAQSDLEAFMGRALGPSDHVARTHHVEVSSVVQIDAISPDSANRVTNTLMAVTNGHRSGDGPLRVDTIYDEERGRLKVIVTGSITTSITLLRVVETLSKQG